LINIKFSRHLDPFNVNNVNFRKTAKKSSRAMTTQDHAFPEMVGEFAVNNSACFRLWKCENAPEKAWNSWKSCGTIL